MSFTWIKDVNNNINYYIPNDKVPDLEQLKGNCLQGKTKDGRIVYILDQELPFYIKKAFSRLGEYNLKEFQKLTIPDAWTRLAKDNKEFNKSNRFLALPQDVINIIASQLDRSSQFTLQQTSGRLKEILKHYSGKDICAQAASEGNLEILKWAHENDYPWDARVCENAAKNGHLHILKWMKTEHVKEFRGEHICRYAAEGGHWDIIEWAIGERLPLDGICSGAAKGGHLDIIKKGQALGGSIDDVAKSAAINGHLHILQWVKDSPIPYNRADICTGAAEGGHWNIIEWAIRERLPLDGICSGAAKGGHLDIIKKGQAFGGSVDNVAGIAANNGHLHILQWVKDEAIPYLPEEICVQAAEGGHWNIIEWAIRERLPLDGICFGAAKGGYLDFVIAGLAFTGSAANAKVITDVARVAANNGHLHILQWFKDNYKISDNEICAGAALSGNLKSLKWLRENNFPWDERVGIFAATAGNIEMLEWAHKNGCPWDWKKIILRAKNNNQPEAVKWAEEKMKQA